MSIGIVTDSSCDLPSATLLKQGIAAVPLNVHVGNEVYQDWQNLEPSTLYQWMAVEDIIPSTSPPTIERFARVYERYLKAYDHIISIHLSSKLSDTLFYAQEAAEEVDASDRIHFFDSQAVTASLANIVLAVAEKANLGATLEEALWMASYIRDQSLSLYCPVSLKWLRVDGRTDAARTMVGNVLKLRPMLSLQDGDIVSDGLVRQRQVYTYFANCLSKRFAMTPIHLTLALAGSDRGELEALKRAMERAQLNITEGRVQMIGTVMGAQLGPGTLGVAAYPEPSPLLALD